MDVIYHLMNKKFLSVLFLFLVLGCSGVAGKKTTRDYVIGFYNLENLFDTTDDPRFNDEEFLPDGANGWTQELYAKKLHNMASAIAAMKEANGCFHTILGVAEAENRQVLEDLVKQKEIKAAGYGIVHYDSPDPRGIDVALLYRPSEFKVRESRAIPFDGGLRTRDILMVRGMLEGEDVAVFVAHLPSRIGGKGTDTRVVGAEIIHRNAMDLMKKYPGIKIIVMGDMNDDPMDESQTKGLHARASIEETGPEDFFCPFFRLLREGNGSLEYKGKWNLFDIIEVNSNLAAPEKPGLRIKPVDGKGHYGKVFKPAFLTQQSGKYRGTPFRTFSNGKFIDGYSDHYPTYIIIGK